MHFRGFDGFEAFGATMGIFIILIMLLIFVGGLLVMIFYLLSLQRALEACSPQNRKMPPGQVWLQLIPLVNIVWQFINVNNVSGSLKGEFEMLGIPKTEDKPAYGIGLAACICSCCGWIPVLGPFVSIAGFVCFIVYWVNINNYKNKLLEFKRANYSPSAQPIPPSIPNQF
ncbi:MAG: hypothetical protein V2A54_09090 [Bacteroidota bacterium]